MSSTPLELIAFFPGSPPTLEFVESCTPPFAARTLAEKPALTGPFGEPALLVTPEERAALLGDCTAVLLRATADAPPPQRLSGAVTLMQALRDRGAIAFLLPLARKVVGARAFTARLPALQSTEGWIELFVQVFVVSDDSFAWSHTHGMQHFDLPDVECRTMLDGREVAARLLESAMVHLLEAGLFEIGDLLIATEPNGDPLAECAIAPSRPVADHDYGEHGALQLVPRVGAGAPGPSPARPEDDARALLRAAASSRRPLRDLDLRGASLAAAELVGLRADGLNLSGADLRGVVLRDAHLGGCTFDGASLASADLSGATLRACSLAGALASYARLDGARLEDSSARGLDLSGASLRGTRLHETSLTSANLRAADLSGAWGEGVNLRGADLRGARLVGARLDEADLRGADLSDADLSGASLRHADLRGAVLDRTRLDGADLHAAQRDGQPASPPPPPSPPDLAALSALLSQTLAEVHLPEGELRAFLSGVLEGLDRAPDQPPAEWRELLEPLAKAAQEAGITDLDALLRELTAPNRPQGS